MEYHFWIKGNYDELTNKFCFYMYLNPELENKEYIGFLDVMKKQLEKPRSLTQTAKFIEELLGHEREQIQDIGRIIQSAADETWASYLMDSAIVEGDVDDYRDQQTDS